MSSKDKKAGSTAQFQQQFGGGETDEVTEQSETETLLEHPSYQELQKQLTEAEEKATQYLDNWRHLQAEWDNSKKRVERDIANAHKYALEKFSGELLPVVDSLERAILAHAEEASGKDSLLDGVEMVHKMLLAAMEKYGVEQINPEGQPFNPELHQAVSMKTDPNAKSGTVIGVLQKGYLLNKRLVRPALVIVAQ